MIFDIANSQSVNIEIGDWIDVDTMAIPSPDPQWGYSLQVVDIDHADYVWVNIWNTDHYELSAMGKSWILANFRQVEFE